MQNTSPRFTPLSRPVGKTTSGNSRAYPPACLGQWMRQAAAATPAPNKRTRLPAARIRRIGRITRRPARQRSHSGTRPQLRQRRRTHRGIPGRRSQCVHAKPAGDRRFPARRMACRCAAVAAGGNHRHSLRRRLPVKRRIESLVRFAQRSLARRKSHCHGVRQRPVDNRRQRQVQPVAGAGRRRRDHQILRSGAATPAHDADITASVSSVVRPGSAPFSTTRTALSVSPNAARNAATSAPAHCCARQSQSSRPRPFRPTNAAHPGAASARPTAA